MTTTKKVLLHSCCAPCGAAIIEWMLENNVRPTIFFYNPNIFPEEEYEKRKMECVRYAHKLGLEIIDGDYDHEKWLSGIEGLEKEPERGTRCLACFRMRMQATAQLAHELGIKEFTTTLASSRWKSLKQIELAGSEAAARYNDLVFDARNWKKGGLSERRICIIKEEDFYKQTYCGCEFSLR